MTNIERITEWRNGCSCANIDHPEECQECTRALIDAIEIDLRKQSSSLGKELKEAYIDGYESGHNDTVESRYGCAEELADNWVSDHLYINNSINTTKKMEVKE